MPNTDLFYIRLTAAYFRERAPRKTGEASIRYADAAKFLEEYARLLEDTPPVPPQLPKSE